MTDAEEMIAQIYEAFADVDRQGGISWSQSAAIDGFLKLSADDLMKYQEQDTEPSWHALVEDPKWEVFLGISGGFAFLDPVGFRYYLPPVMIRSIRSHSDEGAAFWLTLRNDSQEWTLNQWSALTTVQRRCIKEFLEYMVRTLEQVDENWYAQGDLELFRNALKSYWSTA